MKPHIVIPLLVVCVGLPLVALGVYYLCESLPIAEDMRKREVQGIEEMRHAKEVAEEKRSLEEAKEKAKEEQRLAKEKAEKEQQLAEKLELTKRYFCGDGVAKDKAKATQLLIDATEQENVDAKVKLGALYMGFANPFEVSLKVNDNNFEQAKKDDDKFNKGKDIIVAEADKDNASALFFLGYYDSEVLHDPMGRLLIKKSAELGDANAQYCWGMLSFNVDRSESLKWFRLAAKQGHKDAQKLADQIAKVVSEENAAQTIKNLTDMAVEGLKPRSRYY